MNLSNIVESWRLRFGLTDAEVQILTIAVLESCERKYIARVREVAPATIKKQVGSICSKTSKTSLQDAVIAIFRERMFDRQETEECSDSSGLSLLAFGDGQDVQTLPLFPNPTSAPEASTLSGATSIAKVSLARTATMVDADTIADATASAPATNRRCGCGDSFCGECLKDQGDRYRSYFGG